MTSSITSRLPSWRLLMLPLIGGLAVQGAQAVPSYARQTGMPCEACHTMYPELTPFGRDFKMNGYTITGMQQIQSKGSDNAAALKLNEIPPLSLMLQTSVSEVRGVNKANGPAAEQVTSQFPQQLSLFFAGEISPHMGSFLQITYNHQSDHFTQDQSEIRYANQSTLAGMPLTYGLTLNNTPTMEDPWQGTPAWGFPYITPGAALPSPAAQPFIMGKLAQSVVGLGGYMHLDNHWYADLTGYRSEQAGLGQPYQPSATNMISGVAPYLRLAYDTNVGNGYLEVGAYGMAVNMIPTGITGTSNRMVDSALDTQYELPLGNNELIVRGTYIHENDTWNALPQAAAGQQCAAGTVCSSNTNDSLNTLNLNAAFHFANQQEVSLGIVRTTGTSDYAYYNNAQVVAGVPYGNPNVLSGDASGSPDSTAWIAQYEFLPWQNVQLGVQYTAYTKFNGATTNYDGMGRNASANNTAMVYGWFMW